MTTINPNLPVLSSDDPTILAHRSLCNGFQRRIQQATFRISEQVRNGDRARLDCYIRHVSPQMAHNADSKFPTSLRRAARDPDRHNDPIMPGILYFHVANAIFTYYELVLHGATPELLTALERRIALIEQVADKGPTKFRVIGDDMQGFTLLHRDETPTPFLSAGAGAIQPDPDETDLGGSD